MDSSLIEKCEQLVNTYRERSGTLGGFKRLHKEFSRLISKSPACGYPELLPRLRDMLVVLARDGKELSDYLHVVDRDCGTWMHSAKHGCIFNTTVDPVVAALLAKMASIPGHDSYYSVKDGTIVPVAWKGSVPKGIVTPRENGG